MGWASFKPRRRARQGKVTRLAKPSHMKFEILLSVLAVLSSAIPAMLTTHTTMLSAVALMSVASSMAWFLGLELFGWLALTINVGALAILFVFVLMLLDSATSPTLSQSRRSTALVGTLNQSALVWFLMPMGLPMTQAGDAISGSRFAPASSEFVTLGLHLSSANPDLVILLSLVLTLGLFTVDTDAAAAR
jgi:NADH:ubiquinone oxidoreductase subunit 6 (subunit J)